MKRFILVVVAVLLAACASERQATRATEALYLAVEVSENGRTVAAPKVLGFEGHSITTERRLPGQAAPEYRLVLKPEEAGSGYRVLLDLELPSGKRVGGRVSLLHGEERAVRLDATTTLTVMLMRVDSPEFKALVDAPPRRGPATI